MLSSVQRGARELIARNVELSIPHSDKFLAQAMPTSQWPPNLDLVGFMPSKAAHPPLDRMEGDQVCRVFAKMNVCSFTRLLKQPCMHMWVHWQS